eukprot:g9482.t1
MDSVCIPPTAQLLMNPWTIKWDNTASELQFSTGSTKAPGIHSQIPACIAFQSAFDRCLQLAHQEAVYMAPGILKALSVNSVNYLQGQTESHPVCCDFWPRCLDLDFSCRHQSMLSKPYLEWCERLLARMADTLVSRTRICLQPFPQHSKAGPTQSYMLEREQHLRTLEAQEAFELKQQDEQEGLIQALLKQIEQLSTRFAVLRHGSKTRSLQLKSPILSQVPRCNSELLNRPKREARLCQLQARPLLEPYLHKVQKHGMLTMISASVQRMLGPGLCHGACRPGNSRRI